MALLLIGKLPQTAFILNNWHTTEPVYFCVNWHPTLGFIHPMYLSDIDKLHFLFLLDWQKPVLRSGAEAICDTMSTWKYFDSMAFIRDEMIIAETTWNLSINNRETNETESSSSLNQEDLDRNTESPAPQSTSSFRKNMLELEKKLH